MMKSIPTFNLKNRDLRTPRQKARAKQDKVICDCYLRLKRAQPLVSPSRIMAEIAQEAGMSAPGIRNILLRHGVYKKTKTQP